MSKHIHNGKRLTNKSPAGDCEGMNDFGGNTLDSPTASTRVPRIDSQVSFSSLVPSENHTT